MKIKKLILERYKQFEKTEFEFCDINILAGPNNSGKTSILWAFKVFFYFIRKSLTIRNDSLNFQKHYVHAIDFIPLSSDEELWYNKDARQSQSVRITVEFETGWKGTIILTNMFGQIHVSFEHSPLPRGSSAEDILRLIKKEVAFIPGVVGVLVQEPFSTPVRQVSLASEGRYAEIFRSSLVRLSNDKPSALRKINAFLERNLNIRLLRPEFNPEQNEFIISKYEEDGREFDIVACGSGFHQIIQIFVNLLITKPNLVLFDEPDAHLHPSTQGSLASAIEELKDELNAQVFVATHSYDMIDYYDISNILLIDSSASHITPLKSEQSKQEKLIKVGIISNSSLVRLFSARNSIILEDKLIDIFKGFDRKLRTQICKSNSLRSAQGVSKFGIQKEIIDATTSIIGHPISPLFIQDRDGLPDEYINDLSSLARQDGMKMIFLNRHEIENYLVEPTLIRRILASKGIDITDQEAKELIKSVIASNKHEWIDKIRDRVVQVNHILRRLNGRANKTETQARGEVDRFVEDIGNELKRLISVLPGKELIREIRSKIQHDYRISFTDEELIQQTDRRISRDLMTIFNEINDELS